MRFRSRKPKVQFSIRIENQWASVSFRCTETRKPEISVHQQKITITFPYVFFRKTTTRLLSHQLRNAALNATKKPRRRSSHGGSGNVSADILSTSAVGDEVVFGTLCAMDEPILSNIFSIASPTATIVIQINDNSWITIIRFEGTGTDIFKYRINCCRQCEDAKRMEEILGICKSGNFYVANILMTSRIFALSSIPLDSILENANCLSVICYVIGSNGLPEFVADCSTRFVDLQLFKGSHRA